MSKSILTVDDSKTIRDMLKFTLASAGFDVSQAEDGVDGLRVLKSAGAFDIIITDINMPNMDGFEFIENVRRDPEYKSTPILVLTTESGPDKKMRAREVGATGWIVKPFDPQKLLDVIRKVSP
ncbi:MAG: response regulator [Alphaproteobacteria bacterium]|nr:response regulator [Alphaproteobacteria bacterium]